MESSSRTFLRGALILGVAAIVSKLLGSVYTVLLQNLIGDRGMGLYQMAYPIYATLLIISTAGFPVAVSKYVSEYTALGDVGTARRIYRVSLALLAVIGFICAVGLYFGAGFFARLSGDQNAVYAIQAIAPALFIVPAMSSMRGYFQGWQMMNPTAVSQVVEQLVRVVTILVGAYAVVHLGFGDSSAAAAAAFGAVSGGIAGIAAMGYYFWRYRDPHHLAAVARVIPHERLGRERLSSAAILKRLLYYAIPVSLGALVIPLTSNVDALTVTNLLKHQGISQAMATSDFGLLAGRAFKLMMLPAALASSIGTALMPSVSQAHALRDARDTSARILLGLRVAVLFSLPAAAGLFILGRPIDIALFRNAAGYHSIQILGLATFFSSVQIALAASLQGLGKVYVPLRSLVIGTALKVALNFILVPRYGIDGAAVATSVSYAVAAALNLASVAKLMRMKMTLANHLVKSALATFVMGAVTFAVYNQWQRMAFGLPSRISAASVTVLTVAVGGFVYCFMLVLVGALGEQELIVVPKVGPLLARTFRKLGLLAR